MGLMNDAQRWAEETFGGCQLGDKRRAARVVKIASAVARHAGESMLASCEGDEAAGEGLYRLLRNEQVEPAAIAEGGFLATARAARDGEVLLAIEDSTTLSYRHSVAEELGVIGNSVQTASRGFVVHSVLLVDGRSGQTVGLIEQQRWKRAVAAHGIKHKRKRRRYEDKESFKWQRAGQAMRERLSAEVCERVISVCDREADIGEYLAWQQRIGGRYVVRARNDRCLRGHRQPLWARLASASRLGTHEVSIAQRGGRRARTAQVTLRAQAVELVVPEQVSARGSLGCFALLAREEHAPAGVEPLEWLLLSSETVSSREEAVRLLWIYTQRWRIEEFHKAWKSGTQVEALRSRSAGNLERGIVLLAFVAIRLLQLQEKACASRWRNVESLCEHTEVPCDQVLSQSEWQVLYMSTQKCAPPVQAPSARWAYRALAKLGGWMDTQRSGRPGWQAIWRGWFRLTERVDAHLLTLDLCKRSDQ